MLDYLEYNNRINNKPIFTEEDVKKCKNVLAKILREIIVKEKITMRQFIEKHDAYMKSISASQCKSNYMKNNILKVVLKRDEMTFRLFSYIITNVFKKNIKAASVTLTDANGIETKYETKCTL